MPHIEFLADGREAGLTVAALLRVRFKLTWTQAKRLVENGHIRVAGFACNDVGHRIKARNRVWIREGTVELPPGMRAMKTAEQPPAKTPRAAADKAKGKPAAGKTPAGKTAEQGASRSPGKKPAVPKASAVAAVSPLNEDALVYSDDDVVVVNKPAGLTTMRHEEEAAEFGPRGMKFLPKTLADFVPALIGIPNVPVLPVHRIDRDTSGLVVFARTPSAAAELTKQFRKHTADRRYLALVRGTPTDGRIESVLVPDRGDGRRGSSTAADAEDGKRAVTYVSVLERFNGFALVECRLETGRTHQVRIHLGEAGTPLCGERVYDRPLNGKPAPDDSGATRPLLHAARLGFAHPETSAALRWEVPAPADFVSVLGRLREGTGK
ncbi:RluA family pseudouridine synthase [Fimbriiglobus ruber]|uniref:Ribosomal large subunit pseudouridine synthase D n=1 Tax=Fimbriiglobus ruber TaxID=1908690 RepID=A0A225DXR3_9BACT|nr:pseudouridine synthase [Fimbriiglobus ruber]OWK44364.1 Ribosomal large subunit pseudouridine synthase D [Fimbriiglobus ruber]